MKKLVPVGFLLLLLLVLSPAGHGAHHRHHHYPTSCAAARLLPLRVVRTHTAAQQRRLVRVVQ